MTGEKMQRIAIIGTTGSGKSTLAQDIAALGRHRYVDLDDLRWLPNWTMTRDQDFAAAADAALPENGRWVVAGNYTLLRQIVWGRADTLIWLDYGFFRVFFQLLRRTLRRVATREVVCNGNVETLAKALSGDSILLWFFKSYRRNRKRYAADFAAESYQHMQRIRLTRPAQARDLLSGIAGVSPRTE